MVPMPNAPLIACIFHTISTLLLAHDCLLFPFCVFLHSHPVASCCCVSHFFGHSVTFTTAALLFCVGYICGCSQIQPSHRYKGIVVIMPGPKCDGQTTLQVRPVNFCEYPLCRAHKTNNDVLKAEGQQKKRHFGKENLHHAVNEIF
jgi:hypothetical protein